MPTFNYTYSYISSRANTTSDEFESKGSRSTLKCRVVCPYTRESNKVILGGVAGAPYLEIKGTATPVSGVNTYKVGLNPNRETQVLEGIN